MHTFLSIDKCVGNILSPEYFTTIKIIIIIITINIDIIIVVQSLTDCKRHIWIHVYVYIEYSISFILYRKFEFVLLNVKPTPVECIISENDDIHLW